MTKFHINDNGDAKQCSAEEGNCPFGADAPHFDTKKEAQQHYEQTFKNSFEKPKPVKKTTVYRVGTLSAPETYFDDLNTILDAMDELKPDGRQGRKGGIFASPDLASHSRWVLGNQWNKHEGALDSHEITVDANSVYVYDVEQYEQASAFQSIYGAESEKFKEATDKFWNSGMTLSEWQDWAKENKPDPGSWEIVMSPESMMSFKKVSNRTVIENSPENDASAINHLLEQRRAQKGLIWRKNNLTTEQKETIREIAEQEFDKDFANDMEKIYSKNAYKVEDMDNSSYVQPEIYSAIRRLRKKEGQELQPFSEFTIEEEIQFNKKVKKYLTIIEDVIESETENND